MGFDDMMDEELRTEETESPVASEEAVMTDTPEAALDAREKARQAKLDEKLEEMMQMLMKADEDGLAEMRLWLFKQSCRLENQESRLDEQYEQFEREKEKFKEDKARTMARIEREREQLDDKDEFVEQKLEILRDAYDKLDEDRQQLEEERQRLEKEKSYLQGATGAYHPDEDLFFVGANAPLTIKKRYKDLIKIYHPDNLGGDHSIIQMINREYEALCREWQMKA